MPTTFSEDHFPSAKERGLYSADKRLLFVSPDQEVIKRMAEKDNRIVYFPLPIPTPEMDMESINEHPEQFKRWSGVREELHPLFTDGVIQWLNGEVSPSPNSVGAAVNLANWYLLESNLETWLDNNFGRDEVVVRGTACRLDEAEEGELSNPLQILENGAEQKTATTVGVTPFDGEIASRTGQWLFDHPGHLRQSTIERGDVETADKIFPVLLVYNKDAFKDEKNLYSARLPDNPDLRKRMIKQMIILDFPLTRKMIADMKPSAKT